MTEAQKRSETKGDANMTLAKTDFDRCIKELKDEKTMTIKELRENHGDIFKDSFGNEFDDDFEVWLRDADGAFYAVYRDDNGNVCDLDPNFYSCLEFVR